MKTETPAAPKPVVLVVLDGFGLSLHRRGNAVAEARKPALDLIEQYYPFTTLQASGVAVGLPWGEPGNSEVGHLTMGAGRAIYHHLPRITMAIHDGSFYENATLSGVVRHVRDHASALHLIGLTSSGSVHSYVEHLYALLELAARGKIERVWLHAITDGRDAPLEEAGRFIAQLQERLEARFPTAAIASLIGRFYAMDRDNRWDRIERAYALLTRGKGTGFRDPVAYLRNSYREGVSDEFIEPGYLDRDGRPAGRIVPHDGVIFFNFREDSMRELTAAFAAEPFDQFGREKIDDLRVATMTEYEKNLPGVAAAFRPLEITRPLGRVLAEAGKRQLRIAETEKYAHVAYFFNGGQEKPFPGEERMLVPSLSVPHFDEHPEMRAPEITAAILERIQEYDFVLANFANADMVGHTGNFAAIVKAIAVLDESVGKIQDAVLKQDGLLLITADHGNAEEKIHPYSGEPVTEHTANPVPFYLVGSAYRRKTARSAEAIRAQKKEPAGILIDIAPTVLELMHLSIPPEMTGKSLLPILIE